MIEPKTQAGEIHHLFPWLWHWTISDDRLGDFRSDAFAVKTSDGIVMIDPLPLAPSVATKLQDVCAIIMTSGNHERSAWRYRRELGVRIYAPSDADDLYEEPDVFFDEGTALPGGLRAYRARAFSNTCYLVYTHEDGTGVLFCGDLICHYPGEPYRFPSQPGYFDTDGGEADARRLLELPLTVLCAAHAEPSPNGCREALEGAIARQSSAG
jgi:glyoxylase-like metal-dependent hydrolase (beta-lactamase superfamily II)